MESKPILFQILRQTIPNLFIEWFVTINPDMEGSAR